MFESEVEESIVAAANVPLETLLRNLRTEEM